MGVKGRADLGRGWAGVGREAQELHGLAAPHRAVPMPTPSPAAEVGGGDGGGARCLVRRHARRWRRLASRASIEPSGEEPVDALPPLGRLGGNPPAVKSLVRRSDGLNPGSHFNATKARPAPSPAAANSNASRCARGEVERRRGRSTWRRTRASSSRRARTRSSSPPRCGVTSARASRCKPCSSSARSCRGRPASSATPSRSPSRCRQPPLSRAPFRLCWTSASAPRPSMRARSSPASPQPTSSCAPRSSRPTPRRGARTSRAPRSTRRRAGTCSSVTSCSRPMSRAARSRRRGECSMECVRGTWSLGTR